MIARAAATGSPSRSSVSRPAASGIRPRPARSCPTRRCARRRTPPPFPASPPSQRAPRREAGLRVGVELAIPLGMLDVAGVVDDVGEEHALATRSRRSRRMHGRRGGREPRPSARPGSTSAPSSASSSRPAIASSTCRRCGRPGARVPTRPRSLVTTTRRAGTSGAPPQWSKSRWVRTTVSMSASAHPWPASASARLLVAPSHSLSSWPAAVSIRTVRPPLRRRTTFEQILRVGERALRPEQRRPPSGATRPRSAARPSQTSSDI